MISLFRKKIEIMEGEEWTRMGRKDVKGRNCCRAFQDSYAPLP